MFVMFIASLLWSEHRRFWSLFCNFWECWLVCHSFDRFSSFWICFIPFAVVYSPRTCSRGAFRLLLTHSEIGPELVKFTILLLGGRKKRLQSIIIQKQFCSHCMCLQTCAQHKWNIFYFVPKFNLFCPQIFFHCFCPQNSFILSPNLL